MKYKVGDIVLRPTADKDGTVTDLTSSTPCKIVSEEVCTIADHIINGVHHTVYRVNNDSSLWDSFWLCEPDDPFAAWVIVEREELGCQK